MTDLASVGFVREAHLVTTKPTGSEGQRCTDEADALDVAIAYYRKELDLYQARIDRAETQAAGLITAALAVGALGTTLLAALEHQLGLVGTALTALGAVGLIFSVMFAFGSRDTQTKLSGWFQRVAPQNLLEYTKELLAKREAFDQAVEQLTLDTSDGLATRRAIADSLDTRIALARAIARWREDQVRIAALCLVFGSTALLLGAVMTAAQV